jgi:hypothetical protein
LGAQTYHGWREEGPRVKPRDIRAGKTWQS